MQIGASVRRCVCGWCLTEPVMMYVMHQEAKRGFGLCLYDDVIVFSFIGGGSYMCVTAAPVCMYTHSFLVY